MIEVWLAARRKADRTSPLFCTLDRATYGHPMSGNALYNIVRKTAAAGIKKSLAPTEFGTRPLPLL